MTVFQVRRGKGDGVEAEGREGRRMEGEGKMVGEDEGLYYD